jgi:hypothetical protein
VTRTVARVGDLVQRTGDDRTGRVLGGRVAQCAVCTWHVETRSADFLVEPQNHTDGFHWFSLKTSVDGFLQFGFKTGGDGFSQFGLKTGGGFLG